MFWSMLLWLMVGFAALLCGWLILSPFVCMWWLLDPDRGERFWDRHKAIATAAAIGGFIGFGIILMAGVYICLFFIPPLWSFYIGDVIIMVRVTIAFLLAFTSICCLTYVFNKYEEVRKENRRLSIIAEWVTSELMEYCSRHSLVEKRDEVQGQLNGFLGGPDEDVIDFDSYQELSPTAKREIDILLVVRDELDLRISKLDADAIDGLDDALDHSHRKHSEP